MAIIYTYPKLTDPQGNELIVVSDVNNRNATRLITIASIASLVPSGGGCGSAINGIITGAGDYIAPLCNDVTFVGSGVDISADQATATVTFTVPPYVLPCPTETELGGITGLEIQEGTPPASGSGTYYPVEIIASDCSGAVRVPDAPVLECANLSTIGGIKVGAVDTLVDPTLGQSDTNIMVEVNTNCQAYVPIPATVITCADATTIGGVKAIENTTLTVMPEVAEEGTYYPVEVVKAPGAASQDECRTIVKVPGGQGASCEDVFKTIDIPAGSFDASGCDDTLTLASPLGTIEITSAVQGTVNFEVSCAEPTVRGGMKVATDNTQTDPTLDETGTAYPVEVNTNCEGFVRVPSAPAEYLLKAVTHSTTITTTTNPSRYTLAQLSASGKNFEQIEFDPASVTGATNQVYAKIERPQNVDNYVKIVVKCTVLTADDDGISDERYLMGLHYSSTDVDGASLSYHYQVTGDYDLDDLTSGDQLNQIQFTWYIPVGDLLNSVGNAATAGEDCYIFVKALYDSTSAVDAPVIILGRQWAINPTITQGTLEAAGPLEICVYEIPDTKYENNPPTPA